MLPGTGPVVEDVICGRAGDAPNADSSRPMPATETTVGTGRTSTSWSELRPAARAYVAAISALGLAVVASVAPEITGRDAAVFATLAVLTLIVSFAKVRIRPPRSGATVTACCVIDFTTLLVLGLPSATMTAVVGVWSQLSFKNRRPTPAYQMWFSVGAVALAIQASGRTYELIAARAGLPGAAWLATAVVAAAAVHFLINSALVAGAIGLSTGQRASRVWMAELAWIWPGYLFGFSVAAIAAAAIAWSELALIPFATVLFGLTYRNLRAYVEQSTDSLTDELTGLPNRRYLTAHAERELARAVRERAPLSVMLIDLDNFKSINDRYGHHAGDMALREVARRLQHSIRLYDICARYGGDEFVAILPGCDPGNATRKADTLRAAVAAPPCEVRPHVAVPLQISVGVSAFPADGHSLGELLAVADIRMFSDKGRHAGERHSSHSAAPARASGDGESERALREQLLHAQRLAAIGQLTTCVAHDFHNALTAILGYSELMSRRSAAELAVEGPVSEIARAARHAASLSQWLVRFSRNEPLSLGLVDMNGVVRGVEPMLSRLLGEGITVTTSLSRSSTAVTADATQLEQVLVNLAINAKHAMPQGGALRIGTSHRTVGAGAEANLPAGTYTVLTISDTGVGMAPHERARIFEPLFTMKERGAGTGLGLSMVATIVGQSGGHIAVDGRDGGGTTFTIHLPQAGCETARPIRTRGPYGQYRMDNDADLSRHATTGAITDETR